MIDVVLLHAESRKRTYGNLGKDLSAIETPIWSLMLAGALRKAGKEVAIVDMAAEDLTVDEAARKINGLHPKLTVAVVYAHQPSASTHNMTVAGEVLRQVGSITAMVGGHPSALPERTLKDEGVRIVFVGEGLIGILKWINGDYGHDGAAYLAPIKDTFLYQNTHTPLLDPMADLTELAWDLLPMDRYRNYNWASWGHASRQPYAAFYSSLGCPYACEFCAVQSPFYAGQAAQGMKANSYRRWSPKWVGEQLEHLVKTYGVKHVRIADEMFLLNTSHVEGICDEIIQRDLDLNIYAYARADTCGDQRLLNLMKEAGFNWLCLGFESSSQAIRESVGKKYSNETAKQAVKNLKDAGINLLANHIVGLRGETMEDMKRTLEEAMEMLPEFWNVYCATPYPGSPLYARAVKEGWPLPKTWGDYAQHSPGFTPHGTETVSPAEVVKFRDEAWIKFFTNPSYLSKMERQFSPAVRQEIEAMTQVRLERNVAV